MPRLDDMTFRCDKCLRIRFSPPEVCGPHGETWCWHCEEVAGADTDEDDDNYPED